MAQVSVPHGLHGPSDLLRHQARAAGDRPVVVEVGGRRLTRSQLDAQVSAAAAALIRSGAQPGDRVGLKLATGLDFVRLYLGALRAGLVAVPVNPSYSAAEVDTIAADARWWFCFDTDSAAALLASAPLASDPERDRAGEAPAVLLYTSGASGRPRGAMLSARALLANLDQLAAVRPPLLGADDVVLVPLPLTHVYGLNAGFGAALRFGATAVLADRLDPAAALEVMAAERVTAVVGVPAQYVHWLRQPGVAEGFARVRYAMSGSTPLPRSVVEGYADIGVVLHDGYGLTEAAPVVSLSAPNDPGRRHAGSIGRPLPGVEVELRDQVGEPVDVGDPGRIFVRGANLFSGYWPDGADGPDADGWFGTGDVAVADDDGGLQLVGRAGDLVVVDGFTVYPAEVEAALRTDPRVADVAVVGVADAVTGEAVVAYVVAAPGADLDSAELLAAARRWLPRFAVPRAVEVVPELPHTVTGKIEKWRLRSSPEAAGGAGATG